MGPLMLFPCDEMDNALFAAATTVTLGDGNTASFWRCTWFGSTTLCSRYPTLYKFASRKQRTVASALANHQWVRDMRRAPIDAIALKFLELWREISSADIALHDQQQQTPSLGA
jgi:hypothetical protein